MARTVRTKVYKFEELSKEAQQKAIDNCRDLDNGFDNQRVWEDTVEDAKSIGLKLISLDDHRPNKGEFISSAAETAENIINGHGDTCDTYKTAKSFLNDLEQLTGKDESIEDVSEDKIEELEDEFLKSILEDYRIIYNKDIEYQSSDKAIKETIIANEYEFTADGRKF